MVVIRKRFEVKHHLIKAFRWPGIGLPVVDTGFRVVIEWTDARDRGKEACTFFEDRGTKVAVVDDLIIMRVIGMVCQDIVQTELVGSWDVTQFGHGLQICFFERALFDQTANSNFMGGGVSHLHFNLRYRRIARLAVKRIDLAVSRDRVARPLIATAHHHLVETFQPAKPVATFQINICRVHDLFYRGIPAHSGAEAFHMEQVHAARGA